MGMHTYVKGIMEPDERYLALKKLWEDCEKAGVEVPEDILKYFDYEKPSSHGKEIDIEYKEENEDMEQIFIVPIGGLSSKITAIKFINSY